jgi:uncharacterized protein
VTVPPTTRADRLGRDSERRPITHTEESIVGRLILLVERLRRAGVAVSTTELVDAFEATMTIGLTPRGDWRAALRATLVKRADQLAIFDDLFDRAFPMTRPSGVLDLVSDDSAAPDGNHAPVQGTASTDPKTLTDRLLAAIATGDLDLLRKLASEAIDTFASLSRGGSSEKQYLQRVTRAMDLGALLQRALRQARSSGEGLDEKLALAEAAALVEEFRKLLARELAMRLATLQPVETITTVKYPDDVAFLETTLAQRAELHRAIEPLARKLAARMAQRRRLRRTGKVDVRRTARHSLAFGGVPLEPVFRAKRASRPDLIVLCDVSGSVAEFAHFILSLVHALHEELQRLQTFVFVDGVADVTELFAVAQHELVPMHLVTQPGVVRGDGHSDYGSVLDAFYRNHSHLLRPTSTIIVTGDARSNYRDPRADTLRRISERAHAVYWLNPEPTVEWDTTDSVIGQYKPHCTGVFEVRTTRQLVAAVLEIDAAAR